MASRTVLAEESGVPTVPLSLVPLRRLLERSCREPRTIDQPHVQRRHAQLTTRTHCELFHLSKIG